MSSLLTSLSKEPSIEKVSNETGDFAAKLGAYKEKVVNDFTRYNVDLNQGIAKIAQTNGLNDNQINRVIEEANNQVYLIKYAQLRNFPEREVVFDLASLPNVKNIIDNGIPKVAQAIEKKASWDDNDGDDKLNFFNYSSHQTSSCAADKRKDMKDIVAERLVKEASQLEIDLSDAIQKVADEVYTVAEALIKYDRSYRNSQDIFDKMCKGASVSKHEQLIIKKAMEQKIGQLKEAKVLPADYSLELTLSDINEEDVFSLGKHSMIKVALHSDETPVITDNGKMIKSVNDLVDMAKGIKTKREKVLSLNSQKKKIEAMKGGKANAN